MTIDDIIETAKTAAMITGQDIHCGFSGGKMRLYHNNYIIYSSKNLTDLYLILKGIIAGKEITTL